MPNYRRSYVPGGTFFLTLVTYCRRPLFENPDNINLLRTAVAKIKAEKPFEIVAAAILPDHLHFIWQLPPDDSNYSQRVSRLKVVFTRSLKRNNELTSKKILMILMPVITYLICLYLLLRFQFSHPWFNLSHSLTQ